MRDAPTGRVQTVEVMSIHSAMGRIETAVTLPPARLAAGEPVPRRPSLLAPLCRGERGQALIEFALVMPLMLALLLVLVDFGLAVDHRLVVQHSLSEGVREAQVTNLSNITQTKQHIVDTTVDQSQGILDSGMVDVCYEDQNSNGDPGDAGDKVRVSIDYTYRFSAGGTEIARAFGASFPGIHMNPSFLAALQTKVDGATPCP